MFDQRNIAKKEIRDKHYVKINHMTGVQFKRHVLITQHPLLFFKKIITLIIFDEASKRTIKGKKIKKIAESLLSLVKGISNQGP